MNVTYPVILSAAKDLTDGLNAQNFRPSFAGKNGTP